MKTRSLIRVMLLAVAVATASGCAALSDGLSDAPGGLALTGVPPTLELPGVPADSGSAVGSQSGPDSAPAPAADALDAPPPLVAAADAPAGSSTEKENQPSAKEAPPKDAPDEFHDPFADKDDVVAGEESDPWEGFNSAMFEFNRKLDKYLVKPVAQGYDVIVPNALQKGISNFLHNVRFGPRFINNILQLKFKGAGIELSRLLINSTLGIAGFFDFGLSCFGNDDADRYRLPDGTVFGIISSTTEPFCHDCDRSRLTADGLWYLCLYASSGIDLRRALRGGADAQQLAALIRSGWTERRDRGAEQRLAARDRTPLIPVDTLRRDPHLEMHTRGG